MEILIKYKDSLYWREDSSWYRYDEDNQCFVLTDKSPEQARHSFEKWKLLNTHRYKNLELVFIND